MGDPIQLVALSSAGTLALAAMSGAALKGWQGWLELRRAQGGGRRAASSPAPGRRFELADLKARVRRLEAIAEGSSPPAEPSV